MNVKIGPSHRFNYLDRTITKMCQVIGFIIRVGKDAFQNVSRIIMTRKIFVTKKENDELICHIYFLVRQ